MRYSPSRHKVFARCRRLYYYSYELGYKEITKKPWLSYGTNVDKLLEIYDLNGIEVAIDKIKDYFSDPYDQIDVEVLLSEYHKSIGSTPLPPLTIEGQPGNQFEFKMRINPSFVSDTDIEIHGFIDKVCSHNGFPAIVERKTTSQNISYVAPYWNGLEIDKQVVSYSYAMSEILGGPVNKVFYEVLRKPNKSWCKWFNRDCDLDTYRQNAFSAPSKTKVPMVMSKALWVTQEARDEWLMDLLADDDHLKTMRLNQTSYENMGADGRYAWPRNQYACDAYGGCPFRPVCEGQCQIENLETVSKEVK